MDAQDLADALTSDGDYDFMEKQIAKDPRRDNTRGDLMTRYQSYRNYTESQLSRDVRKVVSLLPEDGTEIQIKDLRAGLNAYGFDTQYQNKILKETGENHRYIRARRNSYEHENSIDKIYLRRL